MLFRHPLLLSSIMSMPSNSRQKRRTLTRMSLVQTEKVTRTRVPIWIWRISGLTSSNRVKVTSVPRVIGLPFTGSDLFNQMEELSPIPDLNLVVSQKPSPLVLMKSSAAGTSPFLNSNKERKLTFPAHPSMLMVVPLLQHHLEERSHFILTLTSN